MTSYEWLAGLKVGDRIAVRRKYGMGHDVAVVSHVTPTQVHTRHLKFRRKDGRSIGGSTWDSQSITQVTEEILARATAENDAAILMSIAQGKTKAPHAILRAMVEVYEAYSETNSER